jgi:polyhydroxyalkanoate synthesis regulator phasin
VHDNQVRETEIIDFAILAQELEAQGKLEDAQETREEVERLKEQVAEFKEAYGQDFDEQIKNLAVEYEQTASLLTFNRPIALTLPNPLPRTKSLTNAPASLILIAVSLAMILSASVPPTFATRALTPLSNTAPSASVILAQELEAQGKLEDAQETREEVERLKEQVAEFKEAYGQDFDEQIKNLAVEYEIVMHIREGGSILSLALINLCIILIVVINKLLISLYFCWCVA